MVTARGDRATCGSSSGGSSARPCLGTRQLTRTQLVGHRLSIASMQVLGSASRDQMVLEWLRSERFKPGAPAVSAGLLDEPDLTDAAENRTRFDALYSYRHPIISQVPSGVEPVWVSIEARDLPHLHIVPTFDWFLDTGGTFRLTDTARHLRPGRGYLSPTGRVAIEHHRKVMAKVAYLAGYDAAATGEVIILIARDIAGPYTIIDGTHRSTALYLSHLKTPNMPWKGMLLAGARIAGCGWNVDPPASPTRHLPPPANTGIVQPTSSNDQRSRQASPEQPIMRAPCIRLYRPITSTERAVGALIRQARPITECYPWERSFRRAVNAGCQRRRTGECLPRGRCCSTSLPGEAVPVHHRGGVTASRARVRRGSEPPVRDHCPRRTPPDGGASRSQEICTRTPARTRFGGTSSATGIPAMNIPLRVRIPI